eukprot:TRINITY_DN5506_c0_g1_i2.p1 TRINITY_DN5506_c0_g1~~TRINITY_DN5506_c0_g1_i2.p1  ORF type:complete len:172 (+),score=34.55 TRINITY_DN5506_c0_g1_i2:61-516(+)
MCIRDRILTIAVGSYFLDTISNFTFIFAGIGTHIFGIALQQFAQDPDAIIVYIGWIIQNAGIGALMLIHLFLLVRYSPIQHRGKVFGLNTCVFTLGFMITGYIGDMTFDRWRTLPYTTLCVIEAAVGGILLCFKANQNNWRQDAELASMRA